MKLRRMIFGISVLLAPPVFATRVAVTASVSTLGAGVVLAAPIQPGRLAIELAINGGTYGVSFTTQQYHYWGHLHADNIALLTQYSPFRGVFHVTGGVIYNDNRITIYNVPADGYYRMGQYVAPTSAIGPTTTYIHFDHWAPYLGVGFGNMNAAKSGFAYDIALGVIYDRAHSYLVMPAAAYSSGSTITIAQTRLQADASRLTIYPVIALRAGYRF